MEEVKITVRLPKDLYSALSTARLEDQRSLNSEIIWLLGQALTQKEN